MLTRMTIQINSKLKSKIEYIAKLEGKSAGKLVGELFEEYVRNKYIDYYIDDLWNRIGENLLKSDFNPDEVVRIVHEVRDLR